MCALAAHEAAFFMAGKRAENSGETAAPGRPFKPGQSGNPGGRPKGLARKVRELVGDDGEKLATLMQDIADGRVEDATVRDRMYAAAWLADRGWGKAPSFAPVEDGDPLERDEIDRAIDEVVDQLAERRQAKAPRKASGRAVEKPGSS